MLDPLPYEVPEEIIPERRSTNDDGTDFQLMKTDKSTYFNFRHKKSSIRSFFILIYFISFRGFHIDYFYHQGERDRKYPFGTGVTWLPKISAFDK
jgi:hypothetical protein